MKLNYKHNYRQNRYLNFFINSRNIKYPYQKIDKDITVWWKYFDATLIWDRTIEGWEYWLKEQINLAYFAFIVEKSDNEKNKISVYIENLLGRYSLSISARSIKYKFILLCRKSKLIPTELIEIWEKII